MGQIVNCDECGNDFQLKLKKKKHGVTIEENYFRCKHCKHKYIAFVTDHECRKMQREIAKLQKSGAEDKDIKILSIRKELKPLMDELEIKYS